MFERTRMKIASMVFPNQSYPSMGNMRWLFLTPGMRKQWRRVGDGTASSVVTAPLLWIGRNFPEAPPALWQKTGTSGEMVRVVGQGDQGGDHPMLELMERPNPFYTGSDLWMATVMDWNVGGNAYWLKLRNLAGIPVQLWWVPSGLMKPAGTETKFITEYIYRPGGEPISIPPEDVVHFRYNMDPENPQMGRSPLSALLQEVFTDQEAADFTAALLGNMGVPGLVVSPAKGTDAAPSPDDVKATKEYMNEEFSGDRRGKPLVMSGPTQVTQFGFNPQQLTLRELRRIPEERVTACLGIPAIVAGLGAGLDRSTFANFAEARQAAYQDNIIPSQRTLAECIRFQLLPDFQPENFRSYRFGFDLSGVRVLQEDMGDLTTRLNVGVVGGWIRVAEARRAVDLEVDETDEVYLRNVSTIEIPAGEEGPTPGSPPQLSPGPNSAESDDGQDEVPNVSIRGAKNRQLTRYDTRLLAAFNRDLHALSIVFHNELEKDFEKNANMVTEAFLHSRAVRSRSNGHFKQGEDFEKLVREIIAQLGNGMDQQMKKRLETNILRVLSQTVDTLNKTANLTGGVSDQAQMDLLEAGGTRAGMIDMSGSIKEALLREITQGNKDGLSPQEIARNIRANVSAGPFPDAGPTYRAQLIARTETRWAQNRSTLAFYKESDQVSGALGMDGTDDPECADRDGKEYTIDEAEAAAADEHPNGTLAFAPIVAPMEGVSA